MTIQDLIEKLQAYDKETEVQVHDLSINTLIEIQEVTQDTITGADVLLVIN